MSGDLPIKVTHFLKPGSNETEENFVMFATYEFHRALSWYSFYEGRTQPGNIPLEQHTLKPFLPLPQNKAFLTSLIFFIYSAPETKVETRSQT